MIARKFSVRPAAASRLSISTSMVALALVSAPAFAQGNDTADKPADAAKDEPNIVVTGTRIKGINPVGSALIPIGREDIEKLGGGTTNDALRRIPQVINFGGSNDQLGGSVIQNTSLNSFFAKSINLRGLGTASTLSLVNGHRVAPQGPNGQLFDADNIPGIAVERIEVVADGGSAIYGSDAIGGVVNYITRQPENTLEAQFRVGLANSVQEYIGSIAAGRKWDTGGFFLAYEYQKRTALEADDRPELFNSDLSPYGGGANPIFSSPANVQFTANGTAYGIPAGTTGGITLGQLSTTTNRQNAWKGADAVPSGERHAVVGTFRQHLGDSITFSADGFYSRRSYVLKGVASTATLTVPNTNPYSPCFAGKADNSATLDCPANGNVLVPYNFLNALGPATNAGYEEIWSISGGLEFKLGHGWSANLSGYYSTDVGSNRVDNQLNTSGLNRALGATVAGTTKPAGVDFFNPFCDSSASTCNSPATLDLFRAYTKLGSTYKLTGGSANIGGSLFDIGGGSVRVALGGELHHDFLSGTGQVSNTRTDNVGIATGVPTSNKRDVKSGYAELFVPIVGSGNAMPGIARLELDVAVRYDHYSDVGHTTNPKIGVNYSPVGGLTFHGSYGTSFRAPTLVDVNKYATAGFLPRNATGAAVGLSPANGSFQYAYPIGGNADLKPEKAKTWSIGFDVSPELVKNVHLGGTYYNIVYTDKVDTAAYNAPIGAVLNSGLYDSFVVYNPVYFPTKSKMTLAQYVAYWNQLTSDPGLPVLGVVDPTTLIAIVDARRNNSGVVKTDGIDFNFLYDIPGNFADFRIGAQANYTFRYKTAPIPGAVLKNEVNHFGYPARFTGKIELGVDKGGFSGTAFINFVNSRTITRDFLPAAVPDSYRNIGSYTTFDLNLRYKFKDSDSGWSNGLAISLSAQNLFDATPPLVVNSGGTPIRFDPSYSSSLGRFVSLQLSKKFY